MPAPCQALAAAFDRYAADHRTLAGTVNAGAPTVGQGLALGRSALYDQ